MGHFEKGSIPNIKIDSFFKTTNYALVTPTSNHQEFRKIDFFVLEVLLTEVEQLYGAGIND